MEDLSCRIISGVTQHWPPFTYITKKPGDIMAFLDNLMLHPDGKQSPDGTQTYHGSEVTLFKALAGHLNFDYIISEPQLHGGFKGMVAEMLMGLSDVGWSQLYFNEWRWKHFDLTTSYDEDQRCLMVNFSLS